MADNEPLRFRKKPVVIEAMYFNNSAAAEAICRWAGTPPIAPEFAYCWQDHEERDCKALCAEAADEIARLRSFRPTPAPRVDALIARLREAAK